MGGLEQLAGNYRNRAKQLRSLAETDKSPRTAELLIKIADSYDKRAATADAIGRTYGELRNGETPNPVKISGAGNQPLWYANSSLLAHRHIGAFFHSAIRLEDFPRDHPLSSFALLLLTLVSLQQHDNPATGRHLVKLDRPADSAMNGR
jgi:hypothetical protein